MPITKHLSRRRPRSPLLLFVLLLVAWSATAHAQSSFKDDVIVNVDGVDITREQLDSAIQDRVQKSYELSDDHLIRLKVLKQLIVETVADKLMSDKEIAKDPALARSLQANRRGLLAQSYANRKTVLKQPTEIDLQRYVAEHPEFFERRKVYHYSELIVSPQTEPRRVAVTDRIRRLEDLNEPTPENLQMVVDWLQTNSIMYGYSKDWRATEAIPETMRKPVIDLAENERKIRVESKGGVIRVLTVYGAYPDPVNPVLAKNAIAAALLERARTARVDAVIDDMLGHANVVLYDKSLSDLKIPAFRGAVAPPSLSFRQKADTVWNFALPILTLLSAYMFFRETAPAEDDGENSIRLIDALTYNIFFRAIFSTLAAAVILFPSARQLSIVFGETDDTSFFRLGFFGVAAGMLTVALIFKVELLKRFFNHRWAGLAVVFLAQMALLSLSD